MFSQAFHDLLKPQWLATLIELKSAGGLAVSELSRRLDSSYMTVKQHCEDLTKLGYLQRSRVPRTEIGRPEIFYRLSEKADGLFPSIPVSFTLEMFDQIRQLFGENAPERLLFQHFQGQEETWKARLAKQPDLPGKAHEFVKLREKDGLTMHCLHDEETGIITLREFHHPLHRIFAQYPRAVALEQRAIELALGTKITREVIDGHGGLPSYVDFVMRNP